MGSAPRTPRSSLAAGFGAIDGAGRPCYTKTTVFRGAQDRQSNWGSGAADEECTMNPTQAGSFTTPVSNALKATIQHHDSAVIIHARGEIDAANEHTWQDLVTKAAAATTAPEPLVVNLNGLDFMGCCAVAVLAHEAERCRRRGVDVRLVSRDRAVARIIHACGYGDVLPVHPTTESALSAT